MAGFVPFFEKPAASESLPEYQFTQFKVSKATLTPTHTVRHIEPVEQDGLKNKIISDLKNALFLSLSSDQIDKIVADLNRCRNAERAVPIGSLAQGERGDEASATDRPNIKLQKDGDKVTNIIVECECGQVIAMDCIY